MSISFQCACGKQYRVKDELGGKSVRCTACGRRVNVPAATEAEGAYDVADDVTGRAERPASAPAGLPRGGAGDVLVSAPIGAHGTVASNPGRLSVNWFKYYNSFPEGPVVWLLTLGLAVVAGVRLGPVAAVIFVLAAVLLAVRDALLVRAKFAGGDVNPGLVISSTPYLVAVHVDLSTGGPPRDAIKIIRQPLARMTGGAPAVGARLATVAVYHGPASGGAWKDVDPTVVNCVTGNAATIARVTGSIPQSAWNTLDRVLARVPGRDPGLYTTWDGNRSGRPGATHPVAAAVIVIVLVGGLVVPVLFGKRKQGGNDSAPARTARSTAATDRVAPPETPTTTDDEPAEPVVADSPARPTADPVATAAPVAPPAARTAVPTSAPAAVSAAAPTVAPVTGPELAFPDPPATADAPAARTPSGVRPSPPAAAVAARPETRTPSRVSAARARAKAKEPEPDGEKVEVLWGSRWFPATVLRRERGKAFVKYEGWSEQSNEWVPPNRVRKPKATGK
jgi:hypothetical protein